MSEVKAIKINLVTLILIIILIIAIVFGAVNLVKSDKFQQLINNAKQTIQNANKPKEPENVINYKEYVADTYKILFYDDGQVTALVNSDIKLWEHEVDINSANEIEQEVASKRDTIMHNIVQERPIVSDSKIVEVYTLNSTENPEGIQDAKVIVKCEDGSYHYIDLIAESVYGTTTKEIQNLDTIFGENITKFELRKKDVKTGTIGTKSNNYNFIYAITQSNAEVLVYMY